MGTAFVRGDRMLRGVLPDGVLALAPRGSRVSNSDTQNQQRLSMPMYPKTVARQVAYKLAAINSTVSRVDNTKPEALLELAV